MNESQLIKTLYLGNEKYRFCAFYMYDEKLKLQKQDFSIFLQMLMSYGRSKRKIDIGRHNTKTSFM